MDVLSATCVTYLAAIQGQRPIILPLWYRLDEQTEIPAVLLRLPMESPLLDALLDNAEVCMAFSLLRKGSVDSVLVWGRVEQTGVADACALLRVEVREMSGRRLVG